VCKSGGTCVRPPATALHTLRAGQCLQNVRCIRKYDGLEIEFESAHFNSSNISRDAPTRSGCRRGETVSYLVDRTRINPMRKMMAQMIAGVMHSQNKARETLERRGRMPYRWLQALHRTNRSRAALRNMMAIRPPVSRRGRLNDLRQVTTGV